MIHVPLEMKGEFRRSVQRRDRRRLGRLPSKAAGHGVEAVADDAEIAAAELVEIGALAHVAAEQTGSAP
jgi:hypothetical protein